MNDVLEFDGIELKYGTQQVLSGIYMKCVRGEITGILGRNGSGKSSLFKVVFGSQTADHRSVRLNERPLPHDFIRQRTIAYLPQANLIPPHVSVAKAFDLFGIDPQEILSFFPDLRDQLDFKPNELSGGFRRVLEVMLILKSPAKFCLLDEPFSGVMPVHVETIKRLLTEAKSDKGIILTDHLYRNVLSVADRLYMLANGCSYPVKDRDDLIARGYLGPSQRHD